VLKGFGGMNTLGAVSLFLLLALYLSVFFGLFSYLFARLSLAQPQRCYWLAPAIWVATEYLRAHFFTGFPWCLLGYALVDTTSLAQIARTTGVYGLSFLLMAGNAAVAALLLKPSRQNVYQLAALTGFVLIAAFTLNPQRKSESARQSVRIVQTNINLDQDWSAQHRNELLNEVANLSVKQLTASSVAPSLILWPETPAPFYFNDDADFRCRMERIATSSNAFFLFGFVDFRPSSESPLHRVPYNSVALLGPQGTFVSQYDKIHLVPFGEYIPYSSLFFFVNKISTEVGNFAPGSRVVVSPLPKGRIGSFICYEAVVPDLVRRFANDGAEVFVNVTNDTWFGDSAAGSQHFLMARMRAIENYRYLLRAANSGISGVVDPLGRVIDIAPTDQRLVLDSSFDFVTDLTTYTKFGDVFAWVCIGAAGAGFVGSCLRNYHSVSRENSSRSVDS